MSHLHPQHLEQLRCPEAFIQPTDKSQPRTSFPDGETEDQKGDQFRDPPKRTQETALICNVGGLFSFRSNIEWGWSGGVREGAVFKASPGTGRPPFTLDSSMDGASRFGICPLVHIKTELKVLGCPGRQRFLPTPYT